MEVSGEEIHTEVCIIKTRLGKMYERAGVHKFSKTLAATSYFEAQAGSYEANSVLRTHKYCSTVKKFSRHVDLAPRICAPLP